LKRGFALLEVMVGITLWAITVVACGTMLSQMISTQRAAERRWESLVACRSALEIACAYSGLSDSTTILPVAAATAAVETLSAGMMRITAVSEGDHAASGSRVILSRLAWRRAMR